MNLFAKRLQGLMLALILVCTGLTGTGMAETAEEEIITVNAGAEISDEAALNRYIRSTLGLQSCDGKEMGTAGGVGRENLSEGERGLYDAIMAQAALVAGGQLQSTKFTVSVIEDMKSPGYTAEEIGVSSVSHSGAANAAREHLVDRINAVILALRNDGPVDLYWFSGSYAVTLKGVKSTTEGDRIVFNSGELIISMHVRGSFSVGGKSESTEMNTKIGTDIQTAKSNAAAIVSENAGKNDYQKLKAYADTVCRMTEYDEAASESASVYFDSKSSTIIHVLDGDPNTKSTVDGYALAFQYLCDLSSFRDVRSWCMAGEISYAHGDETNHIWNMVKLEGKIYLIDLINSDAGDSCNFQMFLRGYTEIINGWWAIRNNEFSTNYYYPGEDTAALYSADYLNLSSEDYKPKELSEEELQKIREFVARCYQLILNRGADEEGLNTWVENLAAGTKTASEIIYGFVYSSEFTGRNLSSGDAVEILYMAMLNRGSDPAGKDGWVSRLESGDEYVDIINGFCGSQEFTALCASYGITPGSVKTEDDDPDRVAAFVKRCYKLILNRGADEEGLNTWVTNLKSGTKTASEIIYGFMYSNEFIGRKLSNDETVEILYKTMLDRGSDAGGKADWLERLANGQTVVNIINGFCGSQEFIGLCREYGIEPGSVKTEEAAALIKAVKAVKKAPEAEAEVSETGTDGMDNEAEQTGTDGTDGPGNDSVNVQNGNEAGGTEALLGEAVQESVMDAEKAEAFVARCYKAALDREAGEAELEGWVGQIVNGEKSPEKIVRGFLFSEEFKARNLSSEEIVKVLYKIYMDREADPEGLSFWTEKLAEGMSMEDVVKGFAASDEFKAVLRDMKK